MSDMSGPFVLFIVLTIILTSILYRRRPMKPRIAVGLSAYEYVKALRSHEWRSERQVKDEMQLLFKRRIRRDEMIHALSILESAGLVQERIGPGTRLFLVILNRHIVLPCRQFKLSGEWNDRQQEVPQASQPIFPARSG
ncbi:MAG: hypothetical protein KGI45_01205 [Patescibacteria group bacterium]|nr:hypothetical protein [Patescibacteria group bacterium]